MGLRSDEISPIAEKRLAPLFGQPFVLAKIMTPKISNHDSTRSPVIAPPKWPIQIKVWVLFFVYGKSGSNGKSTLVDLIRDMLGDYGLHTPTETLLVKQYDNAIPADLARLDGARMVTAIEANFNRHLDEARIKSMTGGEPITARSRMVPRRGLEPPRLAALVPETSASTNSATWAGARDRYGAVPLLSIERDGRGAGRREITNSPALCAFPFPDRSGIMALYIAESMLYARSR